MSQRDSGYERKERDLYETPEWVTFALFPHIIARGTNIVWEPACGNGKMVQALKACAHIRHVIATDIESDDDFLSFGCMAAAGSIITNPPYEQAQEFIEHALRLTEPGAFVCMLLRTDFDHAKSRQHLFGDCPQFAKKIVLTKRIRWFEDSKGSPSFNHAWFIWDWLHQGAPTLAYGP
jgi:hypothetical protein